MLLPLCNVAAYALLRERESPIESAPLPFGTATTTTMRKDGEQTTTKKERRWVYRSSPLSLSLLRSRREKRNRRRRKEEVNTKRSLSASICTNSTKQTSSTHTKAHAHAHTQRGTTETTTEGCAAGDERAIAQQALTRKHTFSLSLLVADQRISSRRLKKSAQRRLRFHQHTVCRLRVLFSGVVVHCVCERETGTWRGEEGEGKESLSLSLSIFLFG